VGVVQGVVEVVDEVVEVAEVTGAAVAVTNVRGCQMTMKALLSHWRRFLEVKTSERVKMRLRAERRAHQILTLSQTLTQLTHRPVQPLDAQNPDPFSTEQGLHSRRHLPCPLS
jgi:hypothetical protein